MLSCYTNPYFVFVVMIIVVMVLMMVYKYWCYGAGIMNNRKKGEKGREGEKDIYLLKQR